MLKINPGVKNSKILKDKGRMIVNVAIKRFIYYGIAKTTMDDIAKDLALTKPSLYYYYSNKSHLVRAVFDHVFAEYLSLLQALPLNQSLEKILDDVIKIQWKLFKHYALLGYSTTFLFNAKDKILQHKFFEVKVSHIAFLTQVFQAASRSNTTTYTNIDQLVHLYFSCMQGLLWNHIVDKQTLIPTHYRQHIIVYKNARNLSSVFAKGISL